VRRIKLNFKRKARDHGLARNAGNSEEPPALASQLPAPLFAPRVDLAPVVCPRGTLQFAFLSRTVAMPSGTPDWQARSLEPDDQLWRMNLHYMEYLEGADDTLFARLVSAWIEANSGTAPGAWRDSWNSYALSLRVVVWLQELARRGARLSPDLRAEMQASITQQLRFLMDNLETDIGGNHLIKNIKALMWGSRCFRGSEADRWGEVALNLLQREIGVQVLGDGMHYERSPSYHAQVFADLLECRHALGYDPLGGQLDVALHAMAQATVDLAHPDGTPALFNDSGFGMAYAPAVCLAAYERVLGRRPAPRSVFALPKSGYWGLRSDEAYLVIDCGRIAPDDLPAHGHGDVLSFELSVRGERMIVDQGVFEYIAGDKRCQSRSARCHNTLYFAGADQADFFGAFRCGRRPNVEVRAYQARPNGFILEGSHDGFCSLPGQPVHVRTFDVSPHSLEIHDRIEGKTSIVAEMGLLLHPDVAIETAGRNVMLSRGSARVKLAASHAFAIEPAVWWPAMGVEVATSRLVARLAPGERDARIRFDIN
jgi:uncharacterized heparinase superfamily protein